MLRKLNIIAIVLNEGLVLHFLLSVSLFKSKPKKSETENWGDKAVLLHLHYKN